MRTTADEQAPKGEAACRAEVPAPVDELAVLVRKAGQVRRPPTGSCRFSLKIGLFFDGTGNNLDADIGTREHSNVARLYLAHEDNDQGRGIFRRYIPGLGTYFRDIGDPGEDSGLAFARRGEARLQWAMREVDEILKRYPPQQVISLRFSLFGFSRGAALARAFARRLAERCQRRGTGWVWREGGFDTRIAFMGLFDTVASVGLPAGASPAGTAAALGAWLTPILAARRANPDCGLQALAFGARDGADPTPGPIDGHMAWASDLRIPALVEKCVHMVSAHEVRNSFPLDSVREGLRYPSNCEEYVHPGVHSDVGGGYRPGEGGKSESFRELLSLVPLHSMYRKAREHDVALRTMSALERMGLQDDFVVSPKLLERWRHYMAKAEVEGDVGAKVRAHMRWYFAWRFQSIRKKAAERAGGTQPASETALKRGEQAFAEERRRLQARCAALENAPERRQAEQALRQAERDYQRVLRSSSGYAGMAGAKAIADAGRKRDEARERFAQANDPYLRERAKLSTLPGTGLMERIDFYDQQLLRDAQALQRLKAMMPRARLRSFYAGLLNAYESEFVHNRGLRDPEIIAFFDHYVHDSLAGFAKDETLPSDPRCIYVGGDAEAAYAFAPGANEQEVLSDSDDRLPTVAVG